MNKPLDAGATFIENNFPVIRDDKGKLFSEYASPLVSFFETITDKAPKQGSIYEALHHIQAGGYKERIEKIRNTTNKAERDNFKRGLPAVTVSGTFEDGHAAKNLNEHSGLICFDFDHVPEPEQLKKALCKDIFTFACFISPSGTGVKLIVKIDGSRHAETFAELSNNYPAKYGFAPDSNCKDICRLTFLSYDTNLFLNPNSMNYNTAQDVENIIAQIESKKVDITGNYDTWLKVGFALATEFMEQGRELFHKVSRFHPNYDRAAADNQYNECLKQRKAGIAIGTFFKLAKGAGIDIKPVKLNHKQKNNVPVIPEKKEKPKNETSKFAIVEKYLNERYDFRYNEVSNSVMYREKGNKDYIELNENNLYRSLQLNSVSFSQNNLCALLRSDFVPAYNPFSEYFENLPKWDGQNDHIFKLCSYIKAKDQDRFNKHFQKALVRCIACSLGCSFNKQAFILIGGQSSGKSTFIRWLCPSALKEYISEGISTDKDSHISLSENFIINLDELAGLQRFEITALKSMISKDRVKVRRPYDKKQTISTRRANFWGSTNKDEFLTDETGSVRWQCFEIVEINFAYKTEIDINQVWTQAYELFKQGFEYELTTTEINENETANAIHQLTTPEMELIQQYYEPANKGDEGAEALTATDILQKISVETTLKLNSQNVGKALVRLGFEKVSERTGNEKVPKKVYWVFKKS